MAERSLPPDETFLELADDDGLEHLDDQVHKAQEQLVQLKRQQEQIEKQKRELEELARRQEQLQQGRAELVEQFTRALVILERETYDAQKRVEQLKTINKSFTHHLTVIEGINPKSWENLDINKELNKALSAVDDARAEYARSRVVINAEASAEVLAPASPHSYGAANVAPAQDFGVWLKNGFAFTLPLMILGIVLLVALFFLFPK